MIHTTTVSLSPADVLARAQEFFADRVPANSAFVEKQGPNFLNLRGQGGGNSLQSPLEGAPRRIASLLGEQGAPPTPEMRRRRQNRQQTMDPGQASHNRNYQCFQEQAIRVDHRPSPPRVRRRERNAVDEHHEQNQQRRFGYHDDVSVQWDWHPHGTEPSRRANPDATYEL